MRFIHHPFSPALINEWLQYAAFSTITHSPAYALYERQANHRPSSLYAVHEGDKQIGFFIAQENRFLWDRAGFFILDRGPIWLNGYGDINHQKQFADCLNQHVPPRRFRPRRFIPEYSSSPSMIPYLIENGWVLNTHIAPYETSCIDLTRDNDDLLAAMKPRFRGSLNKANKAGLELVCDTRGEYLDRLLALYAHDKAAKGYHGPSEGLSRLLFKASFENKQAVILAAKRQDRLLGLCGFLLHGQTATYQIGVQTQDGRLYQSTAWLLWHAVLTLRTHGINQLDLGGLNETEAKGVSDFKRGMGGRTVRLIGQFH